MAAATVKLLRNETWRGVLGQMVRIASRQWTAAQAEHLRELIDAGWTAASAAVALKRSIIVVQAKARTLGKTFLVVNKS
jgi:gamma-glutamyltranspeptidase